MTAFARQEAARPAPSVPAERAHGRRQVQSRLPRPRGFGLFEAMFGFVLVIAFGVLVLQLAGVGDKSSRTNAMVDEFVQIRNGLRQIDGNTHTATITAYNLAHSGFIDVRFLQTGDNINTPWGEPVSVTSNMPSIGEPGYQIDFGNIPLDGCLKLLPNLLGDQDITMINLLGAVANYSFSGQGVSLSTDDINTVCNANGKQVDVQIELFNTLRAAVASAIP